MKNLKTNRIAYYCENKKELYDCVDYFMKKKYKHWINSENYNEITYQDTPTNGYFLYIDHSNKLLNGYDLAFDYLYEDLKENYDFINFKKYLRKMKLKSILN